jgi:peptide deformylase
MILDQITKIGDPILRRAVQPVTDFQVARHHAEILTATLREMQGAGLAANQMGIDLNIFVAEVRKTELFPNRDESPLFVMVNARIVDRSSEVLNDFEGCFSVPGYVGEVPRHERISLTYQDLEGGQHNEEFAGYIARVFQHEIDHLNGIIYLDRMPSLTSLATRENYLKRIRAVT